MTGPGLTPDVDAAMRVVEPEQLALFDDPPPPVTDEQQTEDFAAEMDDRVPADAVDVEDYTPREPGFTGVCRGGPYDGRPVPSRFPGGFLLFDKAHARMWRYFGSVERPGEYVCLAGDSVPIADVNLLGLATEGLEIEVLAYDDGPAVT